MTYLGCQIKKNNNLAEGFLGTYQANIWGNG